MMHMGAEIAGFIGPSPTHNPPNPIGAPTPTIYCPWSDCNDDYLSKNLCRRPAVKGVQLMKNTVTTVATALFVCGLPLFAGCTNSTTEFERVAPITNGDVSPDAGGGGSAGSSATGGTDTANGGGQAGGPMSPCPPLTDLVEDPEGYPTHAGVSLKPTELPNLADLPEQLQDRTTFIDNSLQRSANLTACYQGLNPGHRLQIGAVHPLAHELGVSGYSEAQLVNHVQYLHEAGVQLVGIRLPSFDDPPEPPAETIAKYDAVLAKIYELGMQPRIMMPITNSPYKKMEGWAAFRASMLQLVEVVLQRYNVDLGTPFVQVGMHEPSTIAKTVDETVSPAAFKTFIDDVCAKAKSVDPTVLCTASLIADVAGGAVGESEYQAAVMQSNADLYGVNNITYWGLHAETLNNANDFIYRFKNGMVDPETEQWLEGKPDSVFINATWRPTWARTTDKLGVGNAAGIGCSEYDPLDEAFIETMLNYSQAHGLKSVNFFYTQAFIYKQPCTKTVQLYEYVKAMGSTGYWPWYQEGSALTDPVYLYLLAQKLDQDVQLTATGHAFADLAQQFSE